MKTLIKVLLALVAIGGVACGVVAWVRRLRLRAELEEMDEQAEDLYFDARAEQNETDSAE